jgi:small-conductance mechanosensitive channel
MLTVLAQAAPEAADLVETLQALELGKLTRALIIIAVGYSLNRLIETSLDRLGRKIPKRRLLTEKVSSFARISIFIVGTYLAGATLLEDRQSAAIGVMGTLAVALGFALKDTVSSVMSGILILIDQPFQVGDRVRFGEFYGEVREIGLRTVRIVTLDDQLVSIPNNKFLTEAVASANDGDLDMMVRIKFHVAISEDADLVKQLVYRACVTSKYVFLNKPVTMRVVDEEVSYTFVTTVTCKAFVVDARFEKAYVSDVTERVKLAFQRHRIESPYARTYEIPGREWHDHPDDQPDDQQDDQPHSG